MNDTPTRGPMASNMTHQAREATSSRHSLSSNQTNGDLGEGKKHLFEIRRREAARSGSAGQLVPGAFTADAAAAQEHEPIADARRIVDLMDREEQRPPAARVSAQRRGDRARLTQVKALEWLVGEKNWLRRQKAQGEKHALALALRQRAD